MGRRASAEYRGGEGVAGGDDRLCADACAETAPLPDTRVYRTNSLGPVVGVAVVLGQVAPSLEEVVQCTAPGVRAPCSVLKLL